MEQSFKCWTALQKKLERSSPRLRTPDRGISTDTSQPESPSGDHSAQITDIQKNAQTLNSYRSGGTSINAYCYISVPVVDRTVPYKTARTACKSVHSHSWNERRIRHEDIACGRRTANVIRAIRQLVPWEDLGISQVLEADRVAQRRLCCNRKARGL